MIIYAERLLNVVRALRESPLPQAFTMVSFVWGSGNQHPCGTPACALGHYAARADLQGAFIVNRTFGYMCPTNSELSTCANSMEHFDLTEREHFELFGTDGCGQARTTEQAARYIEAFVDRKYPGYRQAAQQAAEQASAEQVAECVPERVPELVPA